jgi:hypothetical protein
MPAPAKKVAAKPAQPAYPDMIKEAIVSLADKQGSSLPAIKKAVAAKHPEVGQAWGHWQTACSC